MGNVFVQNMIDLVRAEIEHLRNVPYKLCYIGKARNSNAGDMLNVAIMDYFKLPYIKARISSANMLNVGSLLNFLFAPKDKMPRTKCKKCIVVGTGFMYEPDENDILRKEPEIYALRGNISKQIFEKRMNKQIDCLLADPGLLVSKMYEQKNIEKKYKVGIISHFLQKDNEAWKNIKLEKYSYKFLDIEQDIDSLMREINECECILSSSLHGLIFADSYNIPCRHLTIYDKLLGEDLKFRDYYSCYEGNIYKSFDIRENCVNDELIDEIINNYPDLSKEVKEKQDALINIYTNLYNKI